MAILVAGTTRCSICGQSIDAEHEWIGLPRLEGLPPLSAALSGASVHRRCLLDWAQARIVSLAWRRWWEASASPSGTILRADDSRLLFFDARKRYFHYVYFSRFIAIREAMNDLPTFSAFLRSSSQSPTSHVELSIAEYSAQRVDDNVAFSVIVQQRQWKAGAIGAATSAVARKEIVRETFSLVWWADFCNI
jgi:hypothetical protein